MNEFFDKNVSLLPWILFGKLNFVGCQSNEEQEVFKNIYFFDFESFSEKHKDSYDEMQHYGLDIKSDVHYQNL